MLYTSLYSVVQGQDGRRGPPGEKVGEELKQRFIYLLHTEILFLNCVCFFLQGAPGGAGARGLPGSPGSPGPQVSDQTKTANVKPDQHVKKSHIGMLGL